MTTSPTYKSLSYFIVIESRGISSHHVKYKNADLGG